MFDRPLRRALILAAGFLLVSSSAEAVLNNPFLKLSWSPSGTSGSNFGFSVHTAGDVDGDGFGDLLVGAFSEDDSLVDEGAAYLFRGTATGTSLTHAWRYHSGQEGAGAGISLATAGDINGDGYDDVAVAVPFWDTATHQSAGKIAIFHGGPAGLPLLPTYERFSPIPAVDQRFGIGVAPAGDVNGDGFADLLVSARLVEGANNRGIVFVFHGGASGLAATPARTLMGQAGTNTAFGAAISSAGDVNGDGFADIVIGAPLQASPFAAGGFAYLFAGSASGIGATATNSLPGTANNEQFGTSVTLVGDINGDDYGDVVVGAPGFNNATGRATLEFGGPTGLNGNSIILPNPQEAANEFIGQFVATLGDLDGDGFGDFGVGGRNTPGGLGRVAVYRGTHFGIEYVGDLLSPATDGFFGVRFGTTGDANGDGMSEIFVATEDMSIVPGQFEGRIFQYRAPRSGLRIGTGWPRSGAQAGTRYGAAVAVVPQFDGVDLPRLVIGDPGFNGVGRVSVHQGNQLIGVNSTEQRSFVAATSFASLGARIVEAGDMNRDGFGDFVVSSTTLDNGAASQAGRVDFHPGALGALQPSSLVVVGTHSFDRVGSALAGRGDVNGDGFHDLLVGAREWDEPGLADCGKVLLYFGSASGPALATPWSRTGSVAGQGFGASVAFTDFDGDGHTDVVVGSSSPTFAATTPGKVEVFYGSPSGPSNTPGLTLTSPVPHVSYGLVVAALGDIDADGVADIAVAAPTEDNRGVVRMYAGKIGRTQSQVPMMTLSSGQVGSRYGETLSGGGDVDGDGRGDFVIGEPGWDGGQTDEGRITLFLGGPLVTLDTFAQRIESNVVGAEFGGALAPMRDLNLDGFADVMVGAPAAAGRVYPYFGGNGPGRWLQFEPKEGSLNRFHPARHSDPDDFPALLYMNTAGGSRSRLKYQIEMRGHNAPFTGVPNFSDPMEFDSGEPGLQSVLSFAADIPASLQGRALKARARWTSPSPFFPRTRWVTPEAHTSGDHDQWQAGIVTGTPPGAGLPAATLRIESVAPNPVGRAAGCVIRFALPAAGDVTMDVIDLAGRRVHRVAEGSHAAGAGSFAWDGRDDAGREVPAGVYFVIVRAGGAEAKAKVVRLP